MLLTNGDCDKGDKVTAQIHSSGQVEINISGTLSMDIIFTPDEGEWTPADLTPSVWLDASVLGLGDGIAISSWTDLSGNGNHAVQATGSRQATEQTNEQNGLSVVRFDGGDDFTIPGLNLGSNFTWYVVFKNLSGSLTGLVDSAPSAANTFRNYPSNIVGIHNGTCNTNLGIADNTIHQFGFFVSVNPTRRIISRKDSAAHDDQGNASTTAVAWGANPAIGSINGGDFFTGDMCEIVAVNRIIDAGEYASLESYLETKWATP